MSVAACRITYVHVCHMIYICVYDITMLRTTPGDEQVLNRLQKVQERNQQVVECT